MYENLSKDLANDLLKISAISLSPSKPFTWASGIKSPIYTDNRLILGEVDVRKKVINALLNFVKNNFADVDVIAGTATAGIPWGSFLANELDLPLCYIRSANKDHGKNNKIEGANIKLKKVIVLEDLISTGGSSLQACEAIRENNGEILAVISIFSYGLERAKENFIASKVKHYSLTNYDTLIEVAKDKNYITECDTLILKEFIKKL